MLAGFFACGIGFALLDDPYKTISLALLLAYLAAGCGVIVFRSLMSSSAPGSIAGALQISRSVQPSLFWLTCVGFLFMGLISLFFSGYALFQLL